MFVRWQWLSNSLGLQGSKVAEQWQFKPGRIYSCIASWNVTEIRSAYGDSQKAQRDSVFGAKSKYFALVVTSRGVTVPILVDQELPDRFTVDTEGHILAVPQEAPSSPVPAPADSIASSSVPSGASS